MCGSGRPDVITLPTKKTRIGIDVDKPTAEWIRKLKNEYICNSNRELILLALSALENKDLPPEAAILAIEKGEPIEEDPLALVWRNICVGQRIVMNARAYTDRIFNV